MLLWLDQGQQARAVCRRLPVHHLELPDDSPGQSTDHPTSKPSISSSSRCYSTRGWGMCVTSRSRAVVSQHVAGEMTGRLVYGVEIAPEFVAVILERLVGMDLEPRLVGVPEGAGA